MKYTRSTIVLLSLTGYLLAQQPATTEPIPVPPAAPAVSEAVATPEAPPAPVTPPPAPPAPAPAPAPAPKEKSETEKLTTDNNLAAEKLKADTNDLRSEITKIKMEKELLAERLSLAAVKRQADDEVENIKTEKERNKLASDAEIAKARAEYLTNQLKSAQAEAGLEVTKLQNEMNSIDMASKRKTYSDSKPQYLENPLREDGTLVISDRRIPLNGAITKATADRITERIDFFNNADKKMPIFIVIDESPGGSVMAGYRILKAMESSEAPVHVVVKSFAASMAAGITTLAKESYAYPNAIILHHQISNTLFGTMNLTQQAEMVKESQRWWERLATPVAQKMGISTDQFIKDMYTHTSSGDWSEFGEEAAKLKWVNHIVNGIEETSITMNPDSKPAGQVAQSGDNDFKEEVGADGKPCTYLPRLSPKDVYFLYNPDSYYRMR